MKLVINTAHGGFEVSKGFYDYYNIPCVLYFGGICRATEPWTDNFRKDPRLIEYIEKFGPQAASGIFSHLKVVEIPKGTKYYISEYDGCESVVTEDDIKWEVAD